uniref:UspA domain-containing protein n=1 Tax=Oryza punctata TaxID=4537 RepID=A0A0E0MMP3_ORYPU
MATRSLPSFCLHRIRSHGSGGAPPRPPSICASSTGAGNDGRPRDDECGDVDGKEEKSVVGRKVMVVVDGGGDEARTALQWALSHSVRPCDTVVLLDVVRIGGAGGKNGDDPSRGCQHLETMRSICQAKRPEIRVELSLVEGKERGPAIVEAARKQGVSLLVMGQKKRSITWRLLMMWMTSGKGGSRGTTEYCVQNAACMALAVRQKSRRGGGYLITTRRQRDFWLLA